MAIQVPDLDLDELLSIEADPLEDGIEALLSEEDKGPQDSIKRPGLQARPRDLDNPPTLGEFRRQNPGMVAGLLQKGVSIGASAIKGTLALPAAVMEAIPRAPLNFARLFGGDWDESDFSWWMGDSMLNPNTHLKHSARTLNAAMESLTPLQIRQAPEESTIAGWLEEMAFTEVPEAVGLTVGFGAFSKGLAASVKTLATSKRFGLPFQSIEDIFRLEKALKTAEAVGLVFGGAAVGAKEAVKDIEQFDFTPQQEAIAAVSGAGFGMTEAWPIVRLFDRLDKGTGGGFTRMLKEGGKQGFEEMVQEMVQRFGQNLTASEIAAYDPERSLWDQIGQAGATGGTVGTILGMLGSAFGVKLRDGRRIGTQKQQLAGLREMAELSREQLLDAVEAGPVPPSQVWGDYTALSDPVLEQAQELGKRAELLQEPNPQELLEAEVQFLGNLADLNFSQPQVMALETQLDPKTEAKVNQVYENLTGKPSPGPGEVAMVWASGVANRVKAETVRLAAYKRRLKELDPNHPFFAVTQEAVTALEQQVVEAKKVQKEQQDLEKIITGTLQDWVKDLGTLNSGAWKPGIIVSEGSFGLRISNKSIESEGSFARMWGGENTIVIDVNLSRVQKRGPRAGLSAYSDVDKASLFGHLAHEMGHGFAKQNFRKEPAKVRRAILLEYFNHVDKFLDMTYLESFTENHTVVTTNRWAKYPSIRKLMQTTDTMRELIKGNKVKGEYILSFDEYLARQMDKFQVSSERSLNTIEKFHARSAKVLRKWYAKNGNKFAPGLSFQAWMEVFRQGKTYSEALAATDRLLVVKPGEKVLPGAFGDIDKLPGRQSPPDVRVRKQFAAMSKDAGVPIEVQKELDESLDKYGWFSKNWATILQLEENNPHISGLRLWVETTRQWAADKNKELAVADETLKAFDNLGSVRAENLSRFMLDQTVADEWWINDRESAEVLGSFAMTEAEIEEIRNTYKLDDEMIEVYYQIRTHLRSMLEQQKAELIRETHRILSGTPLDLQTALADIEKDFEAFEARPYFPLSRFGKYYVSVKANRPTSLGKKEVAENELVGFFQFESQDEASKYLKEQQKRQDDQWTFSAGKLTDTGMSFVNMPPSLIKSLAERLQLTEAQNDELRMVQLAAAPAQSFRKHFKPRKEIGGYSMDAMRSYATYVMHGAGHLSRAKHAEAFDTSIQQVKESSKALGRMGKNHIKRDEILQHLLDHQDYLLDPGNEWVGLRAFGFMAYLGFVPKSAVVNLVQVPMVTLPYLSSRHGDAKSLAALTLAYKDVFRTIKNNKKLKDHEMEMLQAGMAQGWLNESLATEIVGVSQGAMLSRMLPGTKTGRALRQSGSYAAWMFQMAEQLNRRVTALGAYRLELSRLVGKRKENTFSKEALQDLHGRAFMAARKAVDKTQLEYAQWARPRAFRGKKGVLLLFMSYVQGMLAFVAQDQARWRFLGMLMLMAGPMGLPFAEDITELFNLFITKYKQSMGLKKPHTDLRRDLKKALSYYVDNPDMFMYGIGRETLGLKWMADKAGLPAPEVDLSGSLGLGRIIPGVEPLAQLGQGAKVQSALFRTGNDAVGAAYGIPLNTIAALASDNPDTWKRFEAAMPFKFVQNISKAARIAERGEETTLAGKKVAEFDWQNPQDRLTIVATALGFTPTETTRAHQVRGVQNESFRFYSQWRQEILRNLDYAITQDELSDAREGVADVMKSLEQFNRQVPFEEMGINGRELSQSLRQRARTRLLEAEGLSPKGRKYHRLFEEITRDLIGEEPEPPL